MIAYCCAGASKSGFQRFLGAVATIGFILASVVLLALIYLQKLPTYIEQRVTALYDSTGRTPSGPAELLSYPAFLARRFLVIWVPAFLLTTDSAKVQVITLIN